MSQTSAEPGPAKAPDKRSSPLASARKRRAFARNRIERAKSRVLDAERAFEVADQNVRELERLAAKGVRGIG